MMKNLICIVCPKGCHLTVDENHDYAVSGNSCQRGVEYGRNEILNPSRVLTSIVRIENARYPGCSVKTSASIPKDKIWEAMELLKTIRLNAPVRIGDVVVSNICGTGADWIVTKNM